MGLLRGGRDEPEVRRFRMRELFSIGGDLWIEDEAVLLAAVVALEALTD